VNRNVHLELSVGKQVRDAAGEKLGHLHEARARREGSDLVVVDYLVGEGGLLERFSLRRAGAELAWLFGLGRAHGYVIPWDRMDFSDPARPRCTCLASQLQRFSAAPPAAEEKPSGSPRKRRPIP
jgi:hypothetical protein